MHLLNDQPRAQERREGQPGGHLTLLAFVIKAVTAGLRATPAFNTTLDPFKEEMIYKDYYNIGIAVDTGKGLLVPVIHNTDRKSIMEISATIEDLATRAREGTIKVAELQGGTFTITNAGAMGGGFFAPIINYPEVAILGVGQARMQAVVREKEKGDFMIVPRLIMPVVLCIDHRVLDGADAIRFLKVVIDSLEDPDELLMTMV